MARIFTARCVVILAVLLALTGCVAYVPEGPGYAGGYVGAPVVVVPGGYYGGGYYGGGGYRGGYGGGHGGGHGWRR